MDLQIDDFYKDAAGGLLTLYQAFPRKIALYVEDLIGREEPDEFGLPSTRHQSCLGALLWLAEEGTCASRQPFVTKHWTRRCSAKKPSCA